MSLLSLVITLTYYNYYLFAGYPHLYFYLLFIILRPLVIGLINLYAIFQMKQRFQKTQILMLTNEDRDSLKKINAVDGTAIENMDTGGN